MTHRPAPDAVDEDPLHAALLAIRPPQTDASAASLRAAVRRRLFGAATEPQHARPRTDDDGDPR